MRTLFAYLKPAALIFAALFAVHLLVSTSRLSCHYDQDPDKWSSQAQPPLRTGSRHLKFHEKLTADSTSSEATDYTTSTWTSTDREGENIQHYTLERPFYNQSSVPAESLLTLAITRDDKSYGRNPSEPARTIHDFLEFATNTTLAPQQVSLALLTASPSEFERYRKILTPHSEKHKSNSTYFDYPFHRVTLVYHPGNTRARAVSFPNRIGQSFDPADRHGGGQHERRALLAKLRNYLQYVALKEETHLLWLDADVYKFSSNTMVAAMMDKTRTTSKAEVGVLTARCRMGEPEIAERWMKTHPDFVLPDDPKDEDSDEERRDKEERRGKQGGKYEIMAWKTRAMGHYDLNAWRGPRKDPDQAQQQLLWEDFSSWVPEGAPGNQVLDGAIDEIGDDEMAQLDAVGGTVLMLRADLVRMGLIFPMGYMVGMSLEHGEGYDGIETEGLCLLSRSLSRDAESMCYSMGNKWSVWHTVFSNY